MLTKASTDYERLVPGGMSQNMTVQKECKQISPNFCYCATEKSPMLWANFRDFSAKISNRFGEPHKNSGYFWPELVFLHVPCLDIAYMYLFKRDKMYKWVCKNVPIYVMLHESCVKG